MADNTVAIDIEVQVGDLEARLGKIETKLEGIADEGKKAGKEVTSGFKSAGVMAQTMPGPIGAAATAMMSLRAGVMKLVASLKTVKMAIAATGIGALVLAAGALATYFANTERGAQKLRVVMSALGATFSVLSDRVIDIVGGFGKLFSGDFLAGAKEIGGAFLGIGDEIRRDVTAATELTNAFNNLKVSQRELNVETAQRRADIKELNKLAEDVTKSFSERAEAAQKAADLEDELLQKRLANAEEQVRIISQQNALSESTEEDLQKLADAEITLANIRMESMELQTTIQNKLNTIKMQEIALSQAAKAAAIEEAKAAEEAAKIKAEKVKAIEQELADSKIAIIRNEEVRRVLEADANLEAKLAEIEGHTQAENELRANLKQLHQAEVAQIQKEGLDQELAILAEAAKKKKDILDKEKADVKKTEAEKQSDRQKGLAAASSIVGSLGQLAGLMGKQSAESVALQKTMAIAQIAIDTAMSISSAIAGATSAASATGPGAVVATPVFIATQIATVLGALAQVGTIMASVPGPSAGGAISGASANIPASAPPSIDPVTTNTTDLGNAQGAQLAPIQAFVVETEMTGNQQNISQIENQVTFGIDG
jgi:hypothetical protein